MKVLRSLRVRLVVSYLVLAVFLLSVFAVVFWRVIREYSISLGREQQYALYREVQDYLTDLSGQAYTVDQVVALVQQEFPDVGVSVRKHKGSRGFTLTALSSASRCIARKPPHHKVQQNRTRQQDHRALPFGQAPPPFLNLHHDCCTLLSPWFVSS